MKTYKNLKAFENRLKKGIDWGDWIKVGGKVYKMVEYGDAPSENYMLFQNKASTEIIDVRYQVPCTQWVKIPTVCEEDDKPHAFIKGGVDYGNMLYCRKCLRRESEQVQTKAYELYSVSSYINGALYRY